MKTVGRNIRQLVPKLNGRRGELKTQNEELRRAQVQLMDARNAYASLYKIVPVGCVTVNSTGTILDANLAAGKLFGVRRDAMVGKNFRSFIHRASRRDWDMDRTAAFATRGRLSCEVEVEAAPARAAAIRLEGIVVDEVASCAVTSSLPTLPLNAPLSYKPCNSIASCRIAFSHRTLKCFFRQQRSTGLARASSS